MRPYLAAALALLVAAPAPALAHAALVRSNPAAGATVHTPPADIKLEFSEGVVPRLSGLVLRDAAGKTIKTGRPNGSGASIAVPVPDKLSAGTYDVTWHAVSVDTHRSQGRFTFTLAP